MIRWSLTAAVAAACAVAGGCQAPILSADDTAIIGDWKSPVRVYAMRHGLLTLGRRISGVDVGIYVGDKRIVGGKTNTEGFVHFNIKLPKGTKEFEARAVILGRKLTDTGRVYTWPERTIVVLDIDQTISDTDYRALIWGTGEDVTSKPLPGSADTLKQITRYFNVFYLTARPREVLDVSRKWIKRHGFPDAPIITSDSLGQLARQGKYKLEVIRDIQEIVPYLLIGIGDRVTDSEAYGQAGLLTIVLTEGVPCGFRGHAVLVPDWLAVGEFFKANLHNLKDPKRLETVLKSGCMLLRPMIPWAPEK